MNVENPVVFVTVIEYTLKPALQMATVVSVILQCFTVFVATVPAVWRLSWTVATMYSIILSTWIRRKVLGV